MFSLGQQNEPFNICNIPLKSEWFPILCKCYDNRDIFAHVLGRWIVLENRCFCR